MQDLFPKKLSVFPQLFYWQFGRIPYQKMNFLLYGFDLRQLFYLWYSWIHGLFPNRNFFQERDRSSSLIPLARWLNCRIYFHNLSFLWGWVRSSSAVLLAVRAFFQNLNFLWEWVRSLSAVLLAVRWIFQAYFQNLNFFVGNGFDHRHWFQWRDGRISGLNFLWEWIRSSSAVLLAVQVYFQNLNFLWGWVRSSSAVPLAIWSNSRLSLRLEDLGI